jgi:hypothetical protein
LKIQAELDPVCPGTADVRLVFLDKCQAVLSSQLAEGLLLLIVLVCRIEEIEREENSSYDEDDFSSVLSHTGNSLLGRLKLT